MLFHLHSKSVEYPRRSKFIPDRFVSLQWRHNGRDSFSNHQSHDCLLNRLLRRRSKKTLNLRVSGLCAGISPGTGEFPAQMATNAKNVSIWWRHHVCHYSTAIAPHAKFCSNQDLEMRETYNTRKILTITTDKGWRRKLTKSWFWWLL